MNKKITLPIYIFIISIILNISVIILLIVNININSNNSINENQTKDISGIYQSTYYNNYKVQMIETLIINEDGNCEYGTASAEAAGKRNSKCTWTLEKDTIILSFEDNKNITAKKLSNGNIFITRVLNKID